MWTDAQIQGQFIVNGGKEYTFRLVTQYQKEGDSYAVRVMAIHENSSAIVQFGGCHPATDDVDVVRDAVKAFTAEHKIDDLASEKLKDIIFGRTSLS